MELGYERSTMIKSNVKRMLIGQFLSKEESLFPVASTEGQETMTKQYPVLSRSQSSSSVTQLPSCINPNSKKIRPVSVCSLNSSLLHISAIHEPDLPQEYSLALKNLTMKKIQMLQKPAKDENSLCLIYSFLIILAEVDRNIEFTPGIKVMRSKVWIIFDYYAAKPGFLVQIVKKIPKLIKDQKIPENDIKKSLALFNMVIEARLGPFKIIHEILKQTFIYASDCYGLKTVFRATPKAQINQKKLSKSQEKTNKILSEFSINFHQPQLTPFFKDPENTANNTIYFESKLENDFKIQEKSADINFSSTDSFFLDIFSINKRSYKAIDMKLEPHISVSVNDTAIEPQSKIVSMDTGPNNILLDSPSRCAYLSSKPGEIQFDEQSTNVPTEGIYRFTSVPSYEELTSILKKPIDLFKPAPVQDDSYSRKKLKDKNQKFLVQSRVNKRIHDKLINFLITKPKPIATNDSNKDLITKAILEEFIKSLPCAEISVSTLKYVQYFASTKDFDKYIKKFL
jgi:hypothetical protein